MPPSSRLLYYDLGMFADDEGVVEAFTVMRQTNATEDDLRVLVTKGFVKILNEDLVTVIMDWNENNYIRADRLKPSRYRHLLIEIKNACPSDVSQLSDTCPSNVSIGKDRLGKDRIGEDRLGEGNDTIKDSVRASGEAQGDLTDVKSAWNDLPLSDIRGIKSGTKRYTMLMARIREYGIEDVIRAIRSIAESPFLLGRKTDFVITFDWFIRPNNFIKVLEGNYKENNNGAYQGHTGESEAGDRADYSYPGWTDRG